MSDKYYPKWWKKHGKGHLAQERHARRQRRVESDIRPLRAKRDEMWRGIKSAESVIMPRVVKLTIPMHGKNQTMEFFPVGLLANMIGRTAQTIRIWERRGYFATTPYKDENGRRLYSRKMIEAVCDAYDSRGGLMRTNDGFADEVRGAWAKMGFVPKE